MDLAHPAQRGTASSSQETGDIVVPVVPRAYEARKNWIIHERQQSVQPYAIASKKAGRIPNRNPSIDEFLERTDRLLAFLEHDFEISPKYKTEAQLEALFKVILDRTRFHFPQNLKDRARALYEEWEATNWGAADAIESEDGGDDEPQSPTSPTLHSSSLDGGNDRQSVALASIRLPPSDHPIWGVGGIMHGVVPKIGKIKTMQLDRRYLSEKRSAKVFGHNGLQPGDWFASQLVALFHGAHGARIGGIHGTVTDGAYSVVVSGQYKDVDEDRGDTIYYSGPNSQTNTDPINPPAGSTSILERSLVNGTSVRVLRAAVNRSPLAPSVGIRYDGLYRVIRRMPDQKNAKGGVFARYVLKREEGQESLQDIFLRSPTAQQIAHYRRIWNLW